MRIEIPEFLRCCFCLPLRYGILVFAYLNLIFSTLMISLELWLDISYNSQSSETVFMYRGIGLVTYSWFPYFLYAMEIIFNSALIIGAHFKCTTLIRAYYYYGMTTTIAVFITFIVIKCDDRRGDFYFVLFEICLAIFSCVLHIYLLLLIRSELNKVRYREGQFSYVNHMAEVTLDQEGACGRNVL